VWDEWFVRWKVGPKDVSMQEGQEECGELLELGQKRKAALGPSPGDRRAKCTKRVAGGVKLRGKGVDGEGRGEGARAEKKGNDKKGGI